MKAHVLYEAGEHEAGLKFVQGWLPGYAREGLMHCHLSWHMALWQMELGDHEAAMKTYLKGVHPGGSWGPPINVLSDSAAFLWRAELAGRPRNAELWYEVKAYGTKNFPAAGVAFADVHKALAYAATGDELALETLLGQLRERERAGKLLAAPSCRRWPSLRRLRAQGLRQGDRADRAAHGGARTHRRQPRAAPADRAHARRRAQAKLAPEEGSAMRSTMMRDGLSLNDLLERAGPLHGESRHRQPAARQVAHAPHVCSTTTGRGSSPLRSSTRALRRASAWRRCAGTITPTSNAISASPPRAA